jgi:MFS family permease
MPSYSCNYVGMSQQWSCQPQDFCNNPEIQFSFNYEAENSIENWIEKLGLTCSSGWQIGLIGSAYFLGWCSTLLWVPPLADKHGRKPILMFGMLLNLVLLVVLLFSRSYQTTLAMVFLLGALTTIRLPLISNYLVELVGAPYRTIYLTIW